MSADTEVAVRNVPQATARQILHILFRQYPRRTLVGATMMITQSFLYNAIFFTYALVLQNFYGTTPASTQYYFFPFAIGNLLGPLLLGRLFDTWGRRQMILLTYGLGGVTLAVSAGLFHAGVLNALTQTILWCIAFFFASAGASSAYLTVSEVFPLEIRSQVISYFFSVAQVFGALGPVIFGAMIGAGTSRGPLAVGYYFGAGMMIAGGLIAFVWGIDAAGKSLENITTPLGVERKQTAAPAPD
ncbi:MFS transporter [Gordonia iterans]|uniref:MFS transporter n=1 Tax=Gordonia iterans TaxID=1004901 RepID=UPI0018FE8F23|nr:MFS transporter [Gordonia iterans]